ncbi:MAG: hypothetical protein J7518_07395 [Nocardioidaceae bacterium]|nr:hypothetical protein [Nocardioidaceae bacterium]
MPTLTADEEQILRLHRDWYFANFQINIPLMRTVFAKGDDTFLMFNLNDHPYFGVDELAALWSHYAATDEWGLCEDYVMRLDVCGDMAYVVSEGDFPAWRVRDREGNQLPEREDRPAYYRSTEIYKRDDGTGAPEWRMWHFHCSTRPADDEAPPSKTREEATDRRGLGGTPYSRGLRTDYTGAGQ